MAHLPDGVMLSVDHTITDATERQYPYPFTAHSASQVRIERLVSGSDPVQINDTLYAVSLNPGGTGGRIRFFSDFEQTGAVVLANGQTYRIYRDSTAEEVARFQGGVAQAQAVQDLYNRVLAVQQELTDRQESHAQIIIGDDDVKPFALRGGPGIVRTDLDGSLHGILDAAMNAAQYDGVDLDGTILRFVTATGQVHDVDLASLESLEQVANLREALQARIADLEAQAQDFQTPNTLATAQRLDLSGRASTDVPTGITLSTAEYGSSSARLSFLVRDRANTIDEAIWSGKVADLRSARQHFTNGGGAHSDNNRYQLTISGSRELVLWADTADDYALTATIYEPNATPWVGIGQGLERSGGNIQVEVDTGDTENPISRTDDGIGIQALGVRGKHIANQTIGSTKLTNALLQMIQAGGGGGGGGQTAAQVMAAIRAALADWTGTAPLGVWRNVDFNDDVVRRFAQGQVEWLFSSVDHSGGTLSIELTRTDGREITQAAADAFAAPVAFIINGQRFDVAAATAKTRTTNNRVLDIDLPAATDPRTSGATNDLAVVDDIGSQNLVADGGYEGQFLTRRGDTDTQWRDRQGIEPRSGTSLPYDHFPRELFRLTADDNNHEADRAFRWVEQPSIGAHYLLLTDSGNAANRMNWVIAAWGPSADSRLRGKVTATIIGNAGVERGRRPSRVAWYPAGTPRADGIYTVQGNSISGLADHFEIDDAEPPLDYGGVYFVNLIGSTLNRYIQSVARGLVVAGDVGTGEAWQRSVLGYQDKEVAFAAAAGSETSVGTHTNRKVVTTSGQQVQHSDFAVMTLVADAVSVGGVTVAGNEIIFAEPHEVWIEGVIRLHPNATGGGSRLYTNLRGRLTRGAATTRPVRLSSPTFYTKTTVHDADAANYGQGPPYQRAEFMWLFEAEAGDRLAIEWEAFIQSNASTPQTAVDVDAPNSMIAVRVAG